MDLSLQEKVIKEIDEKEIIELAKELIKIPSFTTQETECARFLAKYMRKNGLEVEIFEVEKGREQLIGRVRGSGEGPTLMFNGHMDIDPIVEGWKRDPWKPIIEDNLLYGAGIFNMKSGVASMILAAIAIKRANISLKGDLIITPVVGELQGGVGTVYNLNKGIIPDMAVVTEPYGLNIITVHAGEVEVGIHTIGKSQHISTMEKGINAIEQMTKVINALKQLKFSGKPRADLPGLPRLLIGSIIGGRGREYDLKGPYNVPDFCTIVVDVRYPPGMTEDSIVKDIEKTLKELKAKNPEIEYEIEIFPGKRGGKLKGLGTVPMYPLDLPHDEFIVQALARSHQHITGKNPYIGAKLPLSYAANDTGHLWKAGVPCFLYGPDGNFGVDPFDHYTYIDEMIICTKVLALTALDVCTKSKQEIYHTSSK
jgi:acetylornithine deacetylase